MRTSTRMAALLVLMSWWSSVVRAFGTTSTSRWSLVQTRASTASLSSSKQNNPRPMPRARGNALRRWVVAARTGLRATDTNDDNAESVNVSDNPDILFDPKTTFTLIAGQSIFIVSAVVLAHFVGTPNQGLGPRFCWNVNSVIQGALFTLPLWALAAALDVVEDHFPALQDVSKATQQSVLTLLGGSFKPIVGVAAAVALGVVAGVGEEMLFRGILQYELAQRWSFGPGGGWAWAVGLSSVIFGALHAVTPLYAFLATLASVYFGWMYAATGNLAVPIICHGLYDIGALIFAHWTVCRLSPEERQQVADWDGPGSSLRQARAAEEKV